MSGLNHNNIKWVTPEIRLTVATSLDDDTPLEINLASTIGYKKHVTKTMKPEAAYWLDSRLHQNTPHYRASVLAPLFVQACQKAGFVVMMKEHDDKLPGNRSKVLFVCNRFRFHKPKSTSAASKSKTRSSQRAVKLLGEETCGFKFNVYFDGTRKRWFVPKQQAGSIEHRGHVPLPPDKVKIHHRAAVASSSSSGLAVAVDENEKRDAQQQKQQAGDGLDQEGATAMDLTTNAKDKANKRGFTNDVENYYRARATPPKATVNAYARLLPLFRDLTDGIHTEQELQHCQEEMRTLCDKIRRTTPPPAKEAPEQPQVHER